MRWNFAIANYDKAITYRSDYAEAYCDRGTAYFIRRELDKAIEDYAKAIAYKSDYAKAYLGRGTVYREKGETNLALQDFRKAIELDPQMFSKL